MSDSPSEKNPTLPDFVFAEGQISVRGAIADVKCIAKGGMSYIFRAHQPALGRFIVVKRLKDELIGNPEMMERFKREARALASVLHQNVAHVYDFVEDKNESYIVMEYIDGIDLSTIIEKVGHLPPRVAVSVLHGVVRGTGFIHAHNLIHRDIKPSNIRLTNRGTVKLMDFGIVMDTENQSLTRPGMMVGSPQYLSPEQVLGDTISSRADIFLLGIVLYEMLTGTRPFKDESGETVFQRIRESKYLPPRLLQPSLPKVLEGVIRKCLEKNPDRRYQSCQQLMRDLESFLGPEGSGHTEDLILQFLDEEVLLTPAVEYRHSDTGSRRLLAMRVGVPMWLLSLAVALLVGAVVALWIRPSGGGDQVKQPDVPSYPPARSMVK